MSMHWFRLELGHRHVGEVMQLPLGSLVLVLVFALRAHAFQTLHGELTGLREHVYTTNRQHGHELPGRAHPSSNASTAAVAEDSKPSLYELHAQVPPAWPRLGSLRAVFLTRGKMVNICNQCRPCIPEPGEVKMMVETRGACEQACLGDETCQYATFKPGFEECTLFQHCKVRDGPPEYSLYRKLSPAHLLLILALVLFAVGGVVHCLCSSEDCETDARMLASLEAKEADRRQAAAARALQEAEERDRKSVV